MTATHLTLLAYIDPGTGSMLLQLLLAGALTGMHFAGVRIGKIRAYLASLVKHDA